MASPIRKERFNCTSPTWQDMNQENHQLSSIASPNKKERFNCTSPAWQDMNQESKKCAQKDLFWNILGSFKVKGTKSSKQDDNVVLCKKAKAGNNGFRPWMDKVLKIVSRSVFGSNKERTSAKVASEVDKAFFGKDPIRRNDCYEKPKDGAWVENHLKLLLHSLQSNVNCHQLQVRSAKAKNVKAEDFPVGVLLFQPLENSNLAAELSVSVKNAGVQKQQELVFARLQGEPTIICSDSCKVEEAAPSSIAMVSSAESQSGSPIRMHGLQLTSFLDVMPAQAAAPNKEKLNSVQDFFLYAEEEGKRVFDDFDKDKDGKVTVDDISGVMRKMNLPLIYARKFMHSQNKLWPARSIGWTDFATLMQEKEPTIIRLFNSLGVSKHGTIHRAHVKHLLSQHSFAVSDSTITAMMEAVGGEKDSIKYGQFRKFMLLVPTEQLRSDPWSVWFRAATMGAESEVARSSLFQNVTVLSSSLASHLDAAKSTVATSDLPKVEDVSEFIRSTVKHVIGEPLNKVGAAVPKISG